MILALALGIFLLILERVCGDEEIAQHALEALLACGNCRAYIGPPAVNVDRCSAVRPFSSRQAKMMLTSMIRLLPVAAATLLLAGCAADIPLTRLMPAAQSAATDDPAEISRRFGVLSKVAEHPHWVETRGLRIAHEYKWRIKGAALDYVETVCGKEKCVDVTHTIFYRPESGELVRKPEEEYWSVGTLVGVVQPDGSIDFSEGIGTTKWHLNSDGLMVHHHKSGMQNMPIRSLRRVSPQVFSEATTKWYDENATASSERRRAERESRARFNDLAFGIAGAADAAARDRAVMNQRQQQLQAGAAQASQNAPRPQAQSQASPGVQRPPTGVASQQTAPSRQQPTAGASPSPVRAPAAATQVAQSTGTAEAAGRATPRAAEPPAASKPLVFSLGVSMIPGTAAKSNHSCYSNTITVPAPAGYGSSEWWIDRDARTKALEIIKGYYPQLMQKCAATADGKLRTGVTSAGNITYRVNFGSDSGRFPGRNVPEDVFVQID